MDARALREFYADHPPELDSITDLGRRHFRLLMPNGRFLKIKDRIGSAQDLQRWLVRLQPLDVYYSTSTYLNPTTVASRPRKTSDYWGPGNIVLSHDVAFDIDRRPLSLLNLERARKDSLRLQELVTGLGYPLKYVAFSGSKGFHLVFEDPEKAIEPDHRLREKEIIERRKGLIALVAGEGIEVDQAVTIDTRRIIRLPGTVNSKTGYCCHSISLDRLRSPVTEWIDDVPKAEGHRQIPRFKLKPLRRRGAAKPAATPDRAGIGYTTFVTSPVLGIKGRHAVLISLNKVPLPDAIRSLTAAQQAFDLTDIYLFDLPRSYQAICLKTVQRNRYQKILDSVRSPSAHQLRRYERVSLRMGPLVDERMQAIEPPARFLTYLECPREARLRNFVSLGHVNFLRRHGLAPLEHPRTHGSGEFQIIDAEVQL